jgi:DNA-binding GntR family transcriptional regulator
MAPTLPSARLTEPAEERARPAKFVVYDHMRGRILREVIDEPTFFTEEEIAGELGVSRTPVREAFLMLEAEGFLRLVPRKGALVTPITSRQVREVMEVRSVVETWSATRVLAQEDLRASLLASMRPLHEQLIALGDDDPTALIETDRQFHRALVSVAGNQLMLELYERLRDLQLRMGVRAVLGDPARSARVREEHQRILDALERGTDELLGAIQAHLEATLASLSEREGGAP